MDRYCEPSAPSRTLQLDVSLQSVAYQSWQPTNQAGSCICIDKQAQCLSPERAGWVYAYHLMTGQAWKASLSPPGHYNVVHCSSFVLDIQICTYWSATRAPCVGAISLAGFLWSTHAPSAALILGTVCHDYIATRYLLVSRLWP